MSFLWCGREDLNLHPLQDYHLKVARLPIPPRPHSYKSALYSKVPLARESTAELRYGSCFYPKIQDVRHRIYLFSDCADLKYLL